MDRACGGYLSRYASMAGIGCRGACDRPLYLFFIPPDRRLRICAGRDPNACVTLGGSSDSSTRGRWLALTAFSGAVLAALGIAAFLLLPLLYAQSDSAAFEANYSGAGATHYSWDFLLNMFSPRLFYDVWQTVPNEAAFIPNPTSFPTNFFYVGASIILLVTCLRSDDRLRVRRLQWFFAVAAVLLLGKLMGVWPVQLIAQLPVFRFLHFMPVLLWRIRVSGGWTGSVRYGGTGKD